MELKLNIYKTKNGKREIEKTYIANDYEIMFGTVEDIINALELDKVIGKKITNDELTNVVLKALGRGIPQVSTFLQDIFPGITNDEIKNTTVKEIKNIVLGVIKNAFK